MARPEISASIPTLRELAGQELAGIRDVVLALDALLGDELLDLVVLARVQALEREVLELPLHRVDSEPVRERRIDLERLARLLDLLLLVERLERAHVVQTVGELDEDDPHVGGHRHHHLPVVLGLVFVAALEGDPGELRDPVDQRGDRLAELLADLVETRRRVLDGVVKQRCAERLGVEPQAGADLRDLHRMGDEVLAGLALLVGVALAGERECALDRVAVELLMTVGGVLADDREQVAEELALVGVEILRDLVDRSDRAVGLAGADLDVTAPSHRGR